MNATSSCQYCTYRNGDEFFASLNLSFGNRWRDVGIFIAFIGKWVSILDLHYQLTIRRIQCHLDHDGFQIPSIRKAMTTH